MLPRDDGRDDDSRILSLKFPLGQLVMTPGARDGIPPSEMMKALRRHARGDWGEVGEEDQLANDSALQHGSRLLSAYRTQNDVKFWIITEADRTVTTVLLPEEY